MIAKSRNGLDSVHREPMYLQGLQRAHDRLQVAREQAEKVRGLPTDLAGFEILWYSYLVSFNSTFTQLEQSVKRSSGYENWFATIKEARKSDQLLCYLHHARNHEEHQPYSSVLRSKAVLKPLTKNVRVEYRDSFGKMLEQPSIYAEQNSGDIQLQVILPGVRLRPVVDRGKTYAPPVDYSNPMLDHLILNGSVTVEKGEVRVPDLMLVAVEIVAGYLSEASLLEKV